MTHFYSPIRCLAGVSLALTFVLSTGLSAQAGEGKEDPGSPILDAIQKVDADARRFNEHIVMLSSPFMEGRVPGSRGMEIAKEYMDFWFKQAGLKRPFGEHGFRQPFPLSSTPTVVGSSAGYPGGNGLKSKTDFAPHATNGGKVSGSLVSIGYGIQRGRDNYNSIPADTRLSGKIALVLRGTPIGSAESRWRMSRRYSVQVKVSNAFRAGAAGVIVVAPSFVDGDELATTRHRRGATGPVVSMTRKAANAMLKGVGADQSIDTLAKANDKAGVLTELGGKTVNVEVTVEAKKLMAENVAGLLPGKGALAKELVVIGAHLDHLGMGNFGSRSPNRGKKVHPGADDNASGSAGVLMIAEKMAAEYKRMGDEPRRSVLFMGFSAEESGLNGSRFYADNPLADYKNVLMINFDMIGRVRNNSVSVGGAGTAKGMQEWITKLCAKSPLNARVNPGAGGGSDHLNFLRKGIPVLMGHSGQHPDYHTENDVSDKINRVGAAQVADLFAQIGMHAAVWDSSFEFVQPERGRRRR
jgi:hypothetical protein